MPAIYQMRAHDQIRVHRSFLIDSLRNFGAGPASIR
jgi:hypothetical protein